MRRNLFFLLLLLAGCATALPPNNPPRAAISFPADAFFVQRAVLTVHGRQFTLDGYLALSKTGGKRLIVENFNATLADVLVKPDRKIFVMRSSRLFPPEWIRRYVVADMECIFGGAQEADCPCRELSPTHFVIERREYALDLQIVEIRPGLQPPEMFDETNRSAP